MKWWQKVLLPGLKALNKVLYHVNKLIYKNKTRTFTNNVYHPNCRCNFTEYKGTK